MVDDAEIIARNISATNGIMHVVNQVGDLTKFNLPTMTESSRNIDSTKKFENSLIFLSGIVAAPTGVNLLGKIATNICMMW